MKKLSIAFLALLFSLACAFEPLVSAPTQTPEPTPTDTASPLPTPSPVTPTLTFTSTPTLVGLKTATITPDQSSTPEATITAFKTVTLTASNTAPPPVKIDGFISITISLTEIFKSKGCEPSVVRITAQVIDTNATAFVMLFARFKSMKAERLGKWTKYDMTPLGAGTYIFDLSSDQIKDDAYFETAWIEYQVVSTVQSGTELGRTDIFKERLKMLACNPNATPVTEAPAATGTITATP